MKPNKEYALYYDGPDGTYVKYYSQGAEERIVRGAEAKSALKRLQSSWDQVGGGGYSPDGGVFYFERPK
ncbi:MAG: hypothetical protein IPK52_18685 [Chloroflexi bacterium]|nr:hypothetical protein [Chloroflexota bacterium]